jgi:hypothetical protein
LGNGNYPFRLQQICEKRPQLSSHKSVRKMPEPAESSAPPAGSVAEQILDNARARCSRG